MLITQLSESDARKNNEIKQCHDNIKSMEVMINKLNNYIKDVKKKNALAELELMRKDQEFEQKASKTQKTKNILMTQQKEIKVRN